MSNRYLTRRTVLTATAAAPLAGCGLSQYGMDFDTLKSGLGHVAGLSDPPRVTLDEAAKVPFSTIGYRIGNSGEEMLVLGIKSGSELIWTSAEHKTFSTVNGRIVKSSGFNWNLGGMVFPTGDPIAQGLQNSLPQREVLSYCDYPDLSRFGVPFASRFQNVGLKTISILGQSLPTILVTELRTCTAFNWETQNRYWMDSQNGFVWQSEQTIHPKQDRIAMEILRPPAGG